MILWRNKTLKYFAKIFLSISVFIPTAHADKSYSYRIIKKLGYDFEKVFQSLIGKKEFWGSCELYNASAHVFHGQRAGDCIVMNLWKSFEDNNFSGIIDTQLALETPDGKSSINLIKIFWRPAKIQVQEHSQFNQTLNNLLPYWRIRDDWESLKRIKSQYLKHELQIIFLSPTKVSQIYGDSLWMKLLFGNTDKHLVKIGIQSQPLEEMKDEAQNDFWTMSSKVSFDLIDKDSKEENILLNAKSDLKFSPFKGRDVEWSLEASGGQP